MNSYQAINILDLMDMIGEDRLVSVLSEFSCPKNPGIEKFIRNNAVDFAKKKMSITHLLMVENIEPVAFFTLTHKAVKIQDDVLSSTQRRKIKRYAQLDEETNSYMASAFLIAQLGKNYTDGKDANINGNCLMGNAMDILKDVQHDVGGGVAYLECEDKPQLLKFYQNENNGFRVFGERYSGQEQIKYLQLLKFF